MAAELPLKVLLVEDMPSDAELIERQLRKAGLQFGSMRVQTRDALVAALAEFEPDIMLCDNGLPGFNAAAAIQVAGSAHPDLPIVIVTGTLEDEAAVQLVKAGAVDYVRKDRLARLPIAVTLALKDARQRRMEKEHDTAVLTSELRHRRRFETAMHGILVANAATQRIYDVNPSLVGLLGYAREEYLGKSLADFGLQRLANGEDLPIEAMTVTGDHYQCPALPMRAKDGREVVVEFVAVVFRVGQEVTIQCDLRDVTERIRLERVLRQKNLELEAANLAKDQFLASMSHELRTPLNAIIGFTGTLLMRLPGELTAMQEKQLTTVRSNAHQLLSLINDLLNLALIESGKVELTRETVDCKKLLQSIAASLGPSAGTKKLDLVISVPPCDVMVATSQRAIWQIVTNLTANAIKFTNTGQIYLETRKVITADMTRTEISIRDTGVGIRTEDQGKLFLAFSRVAGVGTEYEEGTGLGLHICKKLATAIGGEINFASVYGKGSIFTLTLPDGAT
jgi:protein-histidine pros-kinase